MQNDDLKQLLVSKLHYPEFNEIERFYYYKKSRIHSTLTPKDLEKEFKLKKIDKVIPSFRRPKVFPTKIVLLEVLNGVVVADLGENRITKIVSKTLEPNFLKNELLANKLLPKNTPKVYSHGSDKKYKYLTTEYYHKKNWLEVDDWSKMMILITPIYSQFINKNKKSIKIFKTSTYLNNLAAERIKAIKTNKLMVKEFKSNSKLFELCLKKYHLSNQTILKVFCHGDITPRNVIRLKKQTLLFDWANGGYQIMFYDLMIQAFYEPNAHIWKKFNQFDFLNLDASYFHGWGKEYIRLVEKTFNLELTSDLIKMCIIIAVAEMDMKNFLRYQTKEWVKDGLIISKHVETIYKNILES